VAHILELLSDEVLLCDGATGTRIQAMPLRLDEDFQGHENCPEILNESRPDLVLEIHRG
jgi:5-methyltetrahydrofolate--homocysteine methyltransferase